MINRPIAIEGAEFRPLETTQAEIVFAAIDAERERLAEWLPWVEFTQGPSDTLTFIEDQARKAAAGTELAAGIWLADEFAGVLGVIFQPGNQSAEIGYWIGSKFEGNGLVTAASRSTLDYLFEERGLAKVEIHCAPENHNSQAIPKRLGFRCVKSISKAQIVGGLVRNFFVYRMKREDWLT